MGFALGAAEYLTKPVQKSRVLEAVSKIVARKSDDILVVEDDPMAADIVMRTVQGDGRRCRHARNGREALSMIHQSRPALVVLDLMMPGEDGLSAARRLAARGWPPVIMLSALGDDADRIVGLEVGADDYLAKPCNPRELVARARAVLRRARDAEARRGAAEAVRFAGFRFDFARRELVDPDGVLVTLSTGEFRLLRAFIERPQRVLSRDQLLDLAFSGDGDVFDRAVDVQVSRLRRKLERDGGGELIRTVRGEGYLFTQRPSPT